MFRREILFGLFVGGRSKVGRVGRVIEVYGEERFLGFGLVRKGFM